MAELRVAAGTPSPGGFRDTDHVHELLPDGPRMADPTWDLSGLARAEVADRTVALHTIPEGYQPCARALLTILGRPTHPHLLASGVVRRAQPARLTTLVGHFTRLRVLAKWGELRGLGSFSEWSATDAEAFRLDLEAGLHKPDGSAASPTTTKHYVTLLKLLYELAPVLPGPITFAPWPHMPAARVARDVPSVENKTPPLPWGTWGPLVRASWVIVADFSADIIAAHHEANRLPIGLRLSRGLTGAEGLDALRRHLDAGGKVPLATGLGRSGNVHRGDVSRALLLRRIGVSKNIFTKAHHAYLPEADEIVRAAVAAGRVQYGGLIEPQALVTHSDGSGTPWISEIGLAEAEHLISVLRAAAYVLIASLSGMRDSEVQSLKRGCVGERDGLTVLFSTQHKGRTDQSGTDRYWWAPTPVIRAVEALEALSDHEGLFSREMRKERQSESPSGNYAPSRDIARLIDFVNADPGTRCGRGSGLGLEPIDVPRGQTVNQSALRRSFAVYAAATPGAEMGLGHQLGHWALRTTTGYASDGMQQAVKMLDDERRTVVRRQVAELLRGTSPLAGQPSEDLLRLRAHIVANPDQAEAIIEEAGSQYHLGVTNDCFYRPATAACGTDGPQLASHFCATNRCGNGLFQIDHLPALRRQLERIDQRLDSPRLHPSFRADLADERVRTALMIQELTATEEP